MIMMMMMMMMMMTNTIPYRRTKTHIWDKVLMGIWVPPITIIVIIIPVLIIITIALSQFPSSNVIFNAVRLTKSHHHQRETDIDILLGGFLTSHRALGFCNVMVNVFNLIGIFDDSDDEGVSV